MAQERRLPNHFWKFFPMRIFGGQSSMFLNLVRVSAVPIAAEGGPFFSFRFKDCRANLYTEAAGDAFAVRAVQLLPWSSS
jgi:hypothetical protein